MTTINEPPQRTQKQAVSMYPDDWETVKRVADITGVRSLSAALRMIIREYERAQQQQLEACHDNLIIVSC